MQKHMDDGQIEINNRIKVFIPIDKMTGTFESPELKMLLEHQACKIRAERAEKVAMKLANILFEHVSYDNGGCFHCPAYENNCTGYDTLEEDEYSQEQCTAKILKWALDMEE